MLENNVKYAQLDPQDLLISQYYKFRKDYLANAEEIVSYIQGLEDERVGKTKTGCRYVKSVTDTKQCNKCGQVGHTARYCRKTAAAQNSERNKRALRKGAKLNRHLLLTQATIWIMTIGFLTLVQVVTWSVMCRCHSRLKIGKSEETWKCVLEHLC